MFERQLAAATGLTLLLALLTAAPAAADVAPVDTLRYEETPVTVTASRYGEDVHLSHTNLTGADIAARQSTYDIPHLIEDVPGVFAYSDAGNGIGYTYLKIRGFDQRRIAVLVNGIPLNDPEDHQVYWLDLPDLASSLEDIQVQRGITNGVGGVTAIGGSVNLVTDVLDAERGGRLTFEMGSYGTTRRMLSYSTGDLGQGFASGLRLSQIESDGYRERAGSEQWAVFWSGQWTGDRHRIQANLYTGDELTRHSWWPAPESVLRENRRYNPEKYWNAVDDFRQPHHELHWEWDITDKLLLRNSLYNVHGEGFYENWLSTTSETYWPDPAAAYGLDLLPGDRWAADEYVDITRRLYVRKDQTGWVPSLLWEHDGGRLVVSGDWMTFHSNHWGDVLAAGAGSGGMALSPQEIPDGLKYHSYTGDKDAWSLNVNERWEFLPGLTLLADLQWQHREYVLEQQAVGNFTGDDRHAFTVTYDFFNPKGGLFWQTPWTIAGGDLGAYGHVGVTHREPTHYDYFGAFAGPEDFGRAPLFATSERVSDADGEYLRWSDPLIEEEKVVNYEAGFAYRGRLVSLTINGYWMDFENEIVPTGYFDAGRGTLAMANAQKTLHRGLELGMRWQPHVDHGLALAVSRSWNEFDEFRFAVPAEDYVEDYSGNPIALFPEAIVSATWTSEIGPVTTRARLRHLGRQYLDSTGLDDRTIDASTTVDLGVFVDVGAAGVPALAGAEAYVRVFNLFDEEYETTGYYAGENYYTPAATRHALFGVNYVF